MSAGLAAAALLIEAAFGYPQVLLRRISHPVMWMGGVLAWLDRRLNRDGDPPATRRAAGIAALLLLLLLAAGIAGWLQSLGLLLAALVASSLLAQRSLSAHVRDVETALRREGVAGGRRAVAHIVGRDAQALDRAGVARAAIESLAENFSDGVVAPALWCALLGLPGIAAYKAVNTADSMIGHRSARHESFGWAAARLDDVVNLPASRLSALWLIAAAALHPDADAAQAARAVWRDASRHRSPNAGWPEAALAGALRLRLAGPRSYGGRRVEDAWMGDGRAECDADDIARALRLFWTACVLQVLAVTVLAVSLRG